MAASSVMSQAGALVVSTNFRKDASDKLDASSQSCFIGSPRSMGRLRPAATPREPSSPRTVSAAFPFFSPGSLFSLGAKQSNADKDADKDNDEDEEEDILSTSSEFLDTVNNVISDVVDGQKYLKETGRTKPRPMKRRSMVVCLAMGAFQPYLSEVEDRMTSLRRTTSNSLAKTVRLVSQLSFGASRQLSIGARQLSITARQFSFSSAEVEQLMPAAA